MATNPGQPAYPLSQPIGAPPLGARPAYPRTTPGGVLYPGHSPNNQASFNRMLQGPVHAGSSLPSEQFAPPGGTPQLQPGQQQGRPGFQQPQLPLQMRGLGGTSAIAAQQQMAFAAANNPQLRMAGGMGMPPGPWPPGMGAPGVNGAPGVSTQGNPMAIPMRYGMAGANGPGVGPAGMSPAYRNAMQVTPQTRPPGLPPTEPGSAAGESARFNTNSADQHPPSMRSETPRVPVPPFSVAQPPPFGRGGPTSQPPADNAGSSPERNSSATPAPSQPPQLVESRDSLVLQQHASRLNPAHPFPQPPGVQLNPSPGSAIGPSNPHPNPFAGLPPAADPLAFRQQQMLLQRQNSNATAVLNSRPNFTFNPYSSLATGTSAPPPLMRSMTQPTPTGAAQSALLSQSHPPSAASPHFPPPPPQPSSAPPDPSSGHNFATPQQQPTQPTFSRPGSTVGGPESAGSPMRNVDPVPASYAPVSSAAIARAATSSPMSSVHRGPSPPPSASDPFVGFQMAHPGTQSRSPPVTLPPEGSATNRLLDFCSKMAGVASWSDVSTWRNFVQTFLTPEADFKILLWTGNGDQSRNFNIAALLLPRFLHRLCCCGVREMSLSIKDAEESMMEQGRLRLMVTATWTYTYDSGHLISLVGPLEVQMQMQPASRSEQQQLLSATSSSSSSTRSSPPVEWVFTALQLAVKEVKKNISLDVIERHGILDTAANAAAAANVKGGGAQSATPTMSSSDSPSMGASPSSTMRASSSSTAVERSRDEPLWIEYDRMRLPPDPTNEFGLPNALIICLDLVETWRTLIPLVDFAKRNDVGPRASIAAVAQSILQAHPEYANDVQNRTNNVIFRPSGGPEPYPAYTNGPSMASSPALQTPKSSHARPSKSSPMQLDRPSSSGMNGRILSGPLNNTNKASTSSASNNVHASPKALPDNASDSSNLSSPPAKVKRKAEDEPEPSMSAADPPPASSSSSRRKNTNSNTHAASAASAAASDAGSSALSTRSTRHRKESSGKSSSSTARTRRRGGTG